MNVPTQISHQDIMNFPFPHKLWCIVNSESCDFIKWNIDGTEVNMKLVSLDAYLNSQKSIFKIQKRSSFIEHLRSYGFEVGKIECEQITNFTNEKDLWPAYSEFMASFKHENFLRHRIDLLAKIRRINDENVPLASVNYGNKALTNQRKRSDDLCYKLCGSLSEISKLRIKHRTILNFYKETSTLKAKLEASEIKSKTKGHENVEEESMIELPMDLFENPHDSVLYMTDDHRTSYAGFYGNCNHEQIFKFFGDYLPMYENSNNEDGERRIVDLNPTEKAGSHPINFEINYVLDTDPTNECENNSTQRLIIPPPSSSLQPIFNVDGEEEEELSMDEFIKFKEQPNNETLDKVIDKSKIKMNILKDESNDENEANFKNFFSQYRESLSLLYEKQ